MKIIITQTDLQQALVNHIAQFGLDVEPSQISIELNEIEIELNPLSEDGTEGQTNTGASQQTKKRTRRSSAEVAAEKAAKEAEMAASTTLDTSDVSALTEGDEDSDCEQDEDSLLDIVDAISQETPITAPAVGGSIFD